MVKKIVELEAKQVELERKLPLAKEDVIAFHPHAALRYRAKVEQIQEALTKGDSAAHEAIQIVRELITETRHSDAQGRACHPRGRGDPGSASLQGTA